MAWAPAIVAGALLVLVIVARLVRPRRRRRLSIRVDWHEVDDDAEH